MYWSESTHAVNLDDNKVILDRKYLHGIWQCEREKTKTKQKLRKTLLLCNFGQANLNQLHREINNFPTNIKTHHPQMIKAAYNINNETTNTS